MVGKVTIMPHVHGHTHTLAHPCAHSVSSSFFGGISSSVYHLLSPPSEHEMSLPLFPEMPTKYNFGSFDHKVAKFYNIQKIQ